MRFQFQLASKFLKGFSVCGSHANLFSLSEVVIFSQTDTLVLSQVMTRQDSPTYCEYYIENGSQIDEINIDVRN